MARIPDKQAVFFEFDGVIVKQPRLLPDGTLDYYPGALDALARIDPLRFSLFVATSREDIAFGDLREREFKKACERFITDCRERGIQIRKIYSCPFHPKGRARYRKDSVFRKPSPGIFKMAQHEFDLRLSRCWMIGHTTRDILAASRADVGTILVGTGKGGSDAEYDIDAHFHEPDIRHASLRIQSFEAALRA